MGLEVKSKSTKQSERTYRCPECGQVLTKDLKDFAGHSLVDEQLPAFLKCGACLSANPGKPVPTMWGDDVEDRDLSHYSAFGGPKKPIPINRSPLKDISFANCKRYLIRVLYHSRLTDAQLVEKAKKEVERFTRKTKVNAIAVQFYRQRGRFGVSPADASVEWCPWGVWGDANQVKTGDYRKHEYVVEFNRTG